MAEPWEEYQKAAQREPWEDYQAAAANPTLTSRLTGAGQISDKQVGARQMISGLASQFGHGAAQGVTLPLNLAYRGVDWLGEKATGGDFLPNIETIKALQSPEPETTGERVARRIGEFAGGAAPFSGGLYATALKYPTVWGLRALARMAPSSVAGYEAGGALLGGGAAQTAEEMGAGPVGQAVAGLAGGVAAPFTLGPVASGLSRNVSGLMARGEEQLPSLLAGTRQPGALASLVSRIPGMRTLAGGADPELGALVPRRPTPPGGPGGRTMPAVSAETEDTMLDVLADKAREVGVTRDEVMHWWREGRWARRLHSAGEAPSAEMIADFNDDFARLLGTQYRHHGEAAATTTRRLEARRTGYEPTGGMEPEAGLTTYPRGDPRFFEPPGLANPAAGQQMRAEETIRRALRIQDMAAHGHGANADETIAILDRQLQAASDPAYTRFRTAGSGVNLQNEPVVTSQVAKWQARAADEDTPGALAEQINYALKQFAPSGKVVRAPEQFDIAKQIVDDQIENLLKAPPGSVQRGIGRKILELKKDLVDNGLDQVTTNNVGPTYKAARDIHGGNAQLKTEVRIGQELYEGKNVVENKAAYDAMDREAQKRVRLGYFTGYQQELAGRPITHDTARILFNTRAKQEMAEHLVERSASPRDVFYDRPERLAEAINRIGREAKTEQIAMRGSPTARNLADDKTSDVLHSIRDIFQGNFLAVGQRGLEYALNKVMGQRADVAAALADRMTSADPAVVRRTVAQLYLRLGQSRAQRLAMIMDRLGARQSQSVGGVPGSYGIAAEDR